MTTTSLVQPAEVHDEATVPRRVGGLLGLTAFAVYFPGLVILMGSTTQTDSPEKVQQIFADQGDTIDLGCALLILAVPLLLAVAVALRDAVAPRGGGGSAGLVLPGVAAFGALMLSGVAMMGGMSFLAEGAAVDGGIAGFAHSAAEACFFYSLAVLGTVGLAVASCSAGRFPAWYRIVAALTGLGMIIGGAGSPLLRDLALLAGLSSYVFILSTSAALLRRPRV